MHAEQHHQLKLRPPDEVMRLDRLGAAFPTRLSFLRAMLRRVKADGWQFSRPVFAIDNEGFGHAVYQADTPDGPLSLVAFSTELAPEQRTDRVIAEAWDTSYVLFDGVPSAADIARLSGNVPRQEAGRYSPRELVLSRANKSMRLFEKVVATLERGQQPDSGELASVGYLMRTTAVYGNGKFGIADRGQLLDRDALRGPFRAEMLTVWLIRTFTIDLAEQVARMRAPGTAVPLAPELRRLLGVGNSTGLGMAPFLVRHPALLDRWITAKETALARVRALPRCDAPVAAALRGLIPNMKQQLANWQTDDQGYSQRIRELQHDLNAIGEAIKAGALDLDLPFDRLITWAASTLSLDGRELLVSLLLEPHGELIDDLSDQMDADETRTFVIDGSSTINSLRAAIRTRYGFVTEHDFTDQREQARFWYTSSAKLEPRLGERFQEAGEDLEQPLGIARDIAALDADLWAVDPEMSVAAFLARSPEHRHVVRRVLGLVDHAYGEISGNLLSGRMRPIDMLRAKLAFFGATRFDPRSDRWLRITLFQGAPFPHELADGPADDWMFASGAAG